MKPTLALLALALALPASAQLLSTEQSEGLAAASRSVRAMRDKLTPAAVDPKPVKALTDRLVRDGEQVEMEQGLGNVYTRIGRPDANGRFKNLQANLVEVPAELAEAPADSMFRQAVMRRYFSHLEATSESWEVDPKTGKGAVHVWIYKVALEGRLLSVEHQVAPVEPDADGQASPVEGKARSYRMSPSDPSVQRRWKALTKELMTLGRVVEA